MIQYIDTPVSTRDLVKMIHESYPKYIRVLRAFLRGAELSSMYYELYEAVWRNVWTMKHEYISSHSIILMLTQLLTGCRFAAARNTGIKFYHKTMYLTVPSVKGSRESTWQAPTYVPLRCARDLINPIFMHHVTYNRYRKELQNTNPNMFKPNNIHHLTCTHLLRHFMIQVLHYVLNQSLNSVYHLLGWQCKESIKAYLDRSVFNIKKGG